MIEFALYFSFKAPPLKNSILLSACALWLLAGCQAPSDALPQSQKLSHAKIAQIAATIEDKHSNISRELHKQLLNMVVRSLDDMIFVEGGEFQMGDFGWPNGDDPTNLCDWPCGVDPDWMGNITMFGDDDFVHPVRLSSYYLSRFQTQLKDFDLFFVVHGKPVFDIEHRDREELQYYFRPNLPTFTKTWQEAKDYCVWLGELSGYPVDLPTEAQWEYAARSRGQHVVFATDNGSLNYGRNFPEPGTTDGNTFPVDSFVPTPMGFYNLSGNATDWVNDWYDENYYRHSPVDDPEGPVTGTLKVKRGTNVLEDPILSATTVRRWGVDPVNEDYFPTSSFRCSIQSSQNL